MMSTIDLTEKANKNVLIYMANNQDVKNKQIAIVKMLEEFEGEELRGRGRRS